jgi:NAD(P)H-dependent FMN reductase
MALMTAVIYGSQREERQGIKAARFIVKKLEKRGHKVFLIDPLEYKFPILKKKYSKYEEPPEDMRKVAGLLEKADGYVIVSAEYNHGVPPALKNILDHYYDEYRYKPAAIMTYASGQFGGVRAMVQLRSILAELRMVTIPSTMPVPYLAKAFDDEGNPLDSEYNRRADKFLEEYEWYANALKNHRRASQP